MAHKEQRLTDKQEAFCRAIQEGKTQRQAYLEAYPASRTWKEAAVDVQASTLASDSKVLVRLAAHRKALEDASILKSADVLAEISRIVFADPRGIMHPDGRIKRMHELDAVTAATVASYEEDDKGGIRYKFWDKNAALEKAAKYLGLYERHNTQKVTPIEQLLASLGASAFPVSKG